MSALPSIVPRERIYGKPRPPLHPMVERLFVEMGDYHTARLEHRAGLSLGTVRHWRGGKTPRIDTFIAALNVLGFDMAIIKKSDAVQ